jgi:hypothetical protein
MGQSDEVIQLLIATVELKVHDKLRVESVKGSITLTLLYRMGYGVGFNSSFACASTSGIF